MALETEAKMRVRDLDALRSKLARLGAANEGDCLERNWVLDNPSNSLYGDGILLRVRNMGGTGGLLTVKRKIEDGEFKTREEVETMVDSTDELLRQFEILGLRPTWIYEKMRQTWLWHDCILALDECPEMGSFVEIEGTPAAIRAACADLGLDPADHIDDSYLGLWIRYLESRGEPCRDMLFSTEENDRHRRFARNTKIIG